MGSGMESLWLPILTYVVLYSSTSGCGIYLVQHLLWLPVKYCCDESIARTAFSRMMFLSDESHSSMNKSELAMLISESTSVSLLFESLLLEASKMLYIGIVLLYLSVIFGSYAWFAIFSMMISFCLVTKKLVRRAGKGVHYRVNESRREFVRTVDRFSGWENAVAFNQLGYEDNRHANDVAVRCSREKDDEVALTLLSGGQSFILLLGLAASTSVALWRTAQGMASPGQVVMLLIYCQQLSAKVTHVARFINTFSLHYSTVKRLLLVLKSRPVTQFRKGTWPLKPGPIQIEFDNVCFSYSESRMILNGFSLKIKPGQTVALTGSSNAGKAAIFELLRRCYETTEGSICLNGQNIRDIDAFR